jgi:4-amino-4-deoxy-L-arabinose transferase-like glycosyltransferase
MGPDLPGRGHGMSSGQLPDALGRIPDVAWILLAWAVMTLPNLAVRSFIWEEGTNAELARHILATGNLLDLTLYGRHWVEKPPALPWLIAATAAITGQVDEWSARLPAMLAVLFTALSVHHLTLRHSDRAAALFAAASYLFCPLLLRKLTIAEPDTLVTALSFAAFLLWWHGNEGNAVRLWRWLACGALLALLALAKGPQPAAFFALGVGALIIHRRRWRAIPGLILCLSLPALTAVAWAWSVHRPGDLSVWLHEMRLMHSFDLVGYLAGRLRLAVRLAVDLVPATLVLPWLPELWRRERSAGGPRVVLALVAYASLGTLAVLLWPGAQTRYAMPAAPAVAVTAGLVAAQIRRSRPWLVRGAGAVTATLAAYQACLVLVVMPLFAERFGATRVAGQRLGVAVAAAEAPAIATDRASNVLFYVARPVRRIAADDRQGLPTPAVLLITRDVLSAMAAARPELSFRILAETTAGPGLIAVLVDRADR